MQESRMIAEVVPPGCCAMPKVSGSRIATPFAPPRPGSTPMITPSTIPASMSSRLNGDSATPKPWISALISSTCRLYPLREAEGGLERPFGQRHREPGLEDQEKCHADADRHRRDLDPRVLADLPHEIGDIDRRGDVEAEIGDERHVHHRRHQDHQDQLELVALDERLAGERRVAQRLDEDRHPGEADEEPDVEREVAGL